MYQYDAGVWRWAIPGLWIVAMADAVIGVLGMPTGFGILFDVASAISFITVAMALLAWVSALLLAIACVPIPRLMAGSFLFVVGLTFTVLQYAELGWKASLAGAVILAITGAALGMAFGSALGYALQKRLSWRKWSTAIAACIVLAAAVRYAPMLASIGGSVSDDDAATITVLGDISQVANASVKPLSSDPSQPGAYTFNYLTYGSGKDKHRSEFGDEVALVSAPVDGSKVAGAGWRWTRKLFWGFGADELPVNGRVWMPEGEGPFPLVLMVHGNHLMEKFSDAGYGYLGELLASRGFIAVSVDENFLNYSAWSGIPKGDMKARAWMLLKHIQQMQAFNDQASSPFYGKVDFTRIALLGHSRGGQAAAMAADRDVWFAGDGGLPAPGSYEVRAVIALAPTDTKIDDVQTRLRNVSYLTLHGAKDADLVNFFGDRQYGRTTFDGSEPERFKASLYIADANHSRFNTEWGSLDNSYPAGLFIRPEGVLQAEDQRKIAKMYVSAFLEAVFHDDAKSRELLRDYRAGREVLPATRYFSRYEDGGFIEIARFEGDPTSDLGSGVTANAEGIAEWRHLDATDRQQQPKGNSGVLLAWNGSEASYSLRWGGISLVGNEKGSLAFSMADQGAAGAKPFKIEIELADSNGVTATLPLDSLMPLARTLPDTRTTWLPGMERAISSGKFGQPSEPVYQTYLLPLAAFQQESPAFQTDRWTSVTFHFHGGSGKVMLDDIGFTPDVR